MVGAGELDQRITFQSYSSVSDGAGGYTRTWANFSSVPTVWAKAQPVRGSEGFEEGRTNATQTYLFTVRYREDVNEADRILWRGEEYNIRTVKRVSGRNINLVIEAERGAST